MKTTVEHYRPPATLRSKGYNINCNERLKEWNGIKGLAPDLWRLQQGILTPGRQGSITDLWTDWPTSWHKTMNPFIDLEGK